eukprot:TRINITY_DN22350_c0_g3_i3.p1 TRINITY_DN22350_c0_g3~~TRINITY_DN22350_c0_g3_i3.p1  ORF type:complete len:585 (-),score=149.06 TRINITY_DN22350_c0_g3_i3:159-1913(-)
MSGSSDRSAPRSGADNDDGAGGKPSGVVTLELKDGAAMGEDIGSSPDGPSDPVQETAPAMEQRHFQVNHPDSKQFRKEFCSNSVTTSQFTVCTFLPKFLVYAFTKLANFYFLVVAVLQTIPSISQTQGLPTILPMLVIMVSVEGVLAAVEDCRRHEADDIANNSPCQIWDPSSQSFQPAVWSQVRVGQIVKLVQGDQIPCDVVILGVHEEDPSRPSGECYVETKSLDGETSLKQRQAVEVTSAVIKADADVGLISGSMNTEMPNEKLNTFNGTFAVEIDGQRSQVAVELPQVLLRGSSIQLTKHAYGLAFYTGHDTKVMMNSQSPTIKQSTIDQQINRMLLFVLFAMWSCCLIGGVGGAIFDALGDGDNWYLGVYYNTDKSLGFGHYTLDAILDFFSYWILMSSFVSISLVVSMVLVKAFQVYFMQANLHMYQEETDTPMKVRTMNLNDDLGVISYILSDKTGTLTDNVMQFRKCTVRGKLYGLGQTEIGRARLRRISQGAPKPEEEQEEEVNMEASRHVDFKDPMFQSARESCHGEEHSTEVEAFVRAMSVCHSAIRMARDANMAPPSTLTQPTVQILSLIHI